MNASRKKQPQDGDEDASGGDEKPTKRRRVKGSGKQKGQQPEPKSTSGTPADTAKGPQAEAPPPEGSADPPAVPKRKARTNPSDLKEAFDGKDG